MNPSSLFKEIADWIGSECPEFEPLIASATGKKTCPSYPDNAGGTKFAVRLADGSFQFAAQDEDFDKVQQSIQERVHHGLQDDIDKVNHQSVKDALNKMKAMKSDAVFYLTQIA